MLDKVCDIYDEYKRKHISLKDYDYKRNIQNAINNNKKLGIDIPKFEFDERFNIKPEIIDVLHDIIYQHSWEEIAGNCFSFTTLANQGLKERLNIQSLVTLGSFSDNGSKVCYESFRMLKFRLQNPNYKTKGIKLHAWLTLPNYHIIDVSILSSLRLNNLDPNIDYRRFYYLDTLNQKKGDFFCYHPMLLGMDYLNKINTEPIIFKVVYDSKKNK